MEILTSTTASKVIPKLDCILGFHGIPEQIKSNNGPLLNSSDFEKYAQKRGLHHRPFIPEQPILNGFAENFMPMLQKVAHTAIIEHKDPRDAVHKYLLAYRATPHTATRCTSPAELLFNRKIKTPVPVLHISRLLIKKYKQKMLNTKEPQSNTMTNIVKPNLLT